jgi:Fe-S-cluster containining protein
MLCVDCRALCCKPEIVLTESDRRRIIDYLGLAEFEFNQHYTRLGQGYVLKKHLIDGDFYCIFLDENMKCSIQAVKPYICRCFKCKGYEGSGYAQPLTISSET